MGEVEFLTAAGWLQEVEELRSALQDAFVGDQSAAEQQRLRRRRHTRRADEDEHPLGAAAYERLVAVFPDAQCVDDAVGTSDAILQDASLSLGIASGKGNKKAHGENGTGLSVRG